MSHKKTFIVLLFPLYVAFLLELGFLTFFRNKLGIHFSPIAELCSSLFISIYPVWLVKKKYISISYSYRKLSISNKNIWIPLVFFFLMTLFVMQIIGRIFQKFPINPVGSDIIPTIDSVYLNKFLSGEFVYESMVYRGEVCTPNYLPLHWMPFIISRFVQIDHRWLAFFVLWVSFLIYAINVWGKNTSLQESLLKIALPFFVLFIFLRYQPEDFGYTIETLIVGYYILLGLSIFQKSSWIRAGGLLLTVLSRYALVLWIPFYFLWLYFRDNGKRAIWIFILLVVGITLLYGIPFLSRDPSIFSKGLNSYPISALGEWKGQSWQVPGDKPYQLFRGIGFSSYFYERADGDLAQKLNLNKDFHLFISLLSILVTGIFSIWALRFMDYRFYALLALKFYLTFFCAFILVPYVYLFLPSVFLSVIILSRITAPIKHL